MRPPAPELLVFDRDGVLVDRETLACRVDAEPLADMRALLELVEARGAA